MDLYQSAQSELTDAINELEVGTNKILCRINSVFPFHLFPDSISVDHNKIDIIYRTFFWNKFVFTILHEDLTTVKISTGFFFANVYFEVKGYEKNPEPITYLWKSDAIRLHQIVTGMNKIIKGNERSEQLATKVNIEAKAHEVGKVNEDLLDAF